MSDIENEDVMRGYLMAERDIAAVIRKINATLRRALRQPVNLKEDATEA